MASLESFKGLRHPPNGPGSMLRGVPHPKIERNKCVLKWFLGKIQCFKPIFFWWEIRRCSSTHTHTHTHTSFSGKFHVFWNPFQRDQSFTTFSITLSWAGCYCQAQPSLLVLALLAEISRMITHPIHPTLSYPTRKVSLKLQRYSRRDISAIKLQRYFWTFFFWRHPFFEIII